MWSDLASAFRPFWKDGLVWFVIFHVLLAWIVGLALLIRWIAA